jgi:hypothetical protein
LGEASNENEAARTTQKVAKQTPSSSCQSNTKEKVDAVRMSLFGDRMLSSTALRRRRNYKEMLLKKGAAGNATIE